MTTNHPPPSPPLPLPCSGLDRRRSSLARTHWRASGRGCRRLRWLRGPPQRQMTRRAAGTRRPRGIGEEEGGRRRAGGGGRGARLHSSAAALGVPRAFHAARLQAIAEADAAAAAAHAAKEAALAADRAANAAAAEEARYARAAAAEADQAATAATLRTLSTRGAGMGLLAEHLSDGVSATSDRRFRVDHYRGRPEGNAEARATLAAAREQQMREQAERAAAEAARDARAAAEQQA